MKKLYLILLVVLSTACDRDRRGMETRTYELHRLSDAEAINVITPYIRDGGYLNGNKRLITIREKPDRLAVIEELLRKYDGMGEASDVILDIRIIEANGFTARDSSITDVEQTLRETFRYRGYRLAGRTRIQTRESSTFSQTVGTAFQINGAVQQVRTTGNQTRVPVEILLRTENSELRSTVTGIMGKPLVLGQSTATGAIIMVIQPSLLKP